METKAKATKKHIRITARKMRMVTDLVRGKRVDDAFHILKYTPKRAAGVIENVLLSCVSNASSVKGVNIDNLVISKIVVDSGPIMKRFMTRAMGRASGIKKRTSHLTIFVGEE
ncbi:MAG: 50S ribosomal protein L22 [Candidatus Firestonebacteria bacterium]|nr:50S ribosomal protein L22 [Candidatus Firestonebacteria bacterium]